MRPLTLASYGRDLRAFASWLSRRNTTLDDVKLPVLEQYFREIGDAVSGHTKQKRSLRSVARYISAVRGFFRWRVVEGFGQKNPAELLDSPKLPRHLPDVMTVEEVDRLIDSLAESSPFHLRDRAMFEVAYSCGLRVSELVQLRRRDVMFEEALVRVRGKGDKERIIPIGERAIGALQHYLRNGRDQIRGEGKEGGHLPLPKDAKDVVFLNRHGHPLSRTGFNHILKERLKTAGVMVSVTPHTFRHTFATHMMEGGADLRVVQELLGHASISTTEIYTHLDRDYLRETVRSFHPRGRIK